MANPYLDLTSLGAFFDTRTLAQLSNDTDDAATPDTAKLQILMDAKASELESHLRSRIALPLSTIPLVLTQWCAIEVADRLYGRRTTRPKGLDVDKKWAADWLRDWDAGSISLGVPRETIVLDYTDPAEVRRG